MKNRPREELNPKSGAKYSTSSSKFTEIDSSSVYETCKYYN